MPLKIFYQRAVLSSNVTDASEIFLPSILMGPRSHVMPTEIDNGDLSDAHVRLAFPPTKSIKVNFSTTNDAKFHYLLP